MKASLDKTIDITPDEAKRIENQKRKADINHKIGRISDEVFDILSDAVQTPWIPVGEAHLEMYMDAISDDKGLAHISDEEKKLRWMIEWRDKYVKRELIDAAADLGHNVMSAMDSVKGKLVGQKFYDEILDRLYSMKNKTDMTEYKAAEREIKEFLSSFSTIKEKWQRRIDERKELLGKEGVEDLTERDVEKIQLLRDEEKFINLPYKEKKALIAKVRQALAKKESPDQPEIAFVEKELQKAVKQKVISQKTADHWLEHVLGQLKKKQDVTELAFQTIPNYLADWRRLRDTFDDLKPKCQEKGIWLPSEAQFLSYPYPVRKQKIEHAQQLLTDKEIVTENPLFKEADRHIKDANWKAARDILATIKDMNPSTHDTQKIDAMMRYIDTSEYVPKKEDEQTKEPDPNQWENDVKAMFDIIDKAPVSIARFCRMAYARKGAAGLRSVLAGFGNLEWARGRKLLDDAKLNHLRKRSVRDTEVIQEIGHSQTGIENVNAGKGQQKGKHNIFRQYDNDMGPTYIHFDENSCDNAMEDVEERCQNSNHNYWIFYAPMHLSLDKIIEVKNTLQPAVQKGLDSDKKLREHQAAQSVLTVEAKPEKTQLAGEIQYSMAA